MKFRKKTTATLLIALFMISAFAVAIPVMAVEPFDSYETTIIAAADTLVATQNTDGGWDWGPADPSDLTSPSPHNTVGVTAQGILDAYKLTLDSKYLPALELAYDRILQFSLEPTFIKNRIRGPDITFLVELSEVTGLPTYADFAKARYAILLADAEVGGTATLWAEYIRDYREPSFPGLISWDINFYVQGALALERYYPEDPYLEDAVAMADVIHNALYGDDVLYDPTIAEQEDYGLAVSGALEAFVTTNTHPTEADALEAALLAHQDDVSGCFPDTLVDNDVQTTAYSVMALLKTDNLVKSIAAGYYFVDTQLDWLVTAYTEPISEVAQALYDICARAQPDDGTLLFATGEPAGKEATIEIPMPEGFTLGQLESISWSVWTAVGYPPHVDIILGDDIDGDLGNIDSLTAEINKPLLEPIYHWGEHSGEYDYGTWLETFEYAIGTGRTEIDLTNTILWVTRHGGGPGDATHGTLAEFRAGTYTQDGGDPIITVSAATSILRLEIEVDNYILDTVAYVKDILVTGSGGTVIDASVKAVRTLETSVQGEGIITEEEPGPPYYEYVVGADTATLTPVPAEDWKFDHWIVHDASEFDVPLEVVMNEDHTVTAVFELVKVVSITVTPTTISFPNAIAGTLCSPTPDEPLTVLNSGTVTVSVTAEIPGTEDGDIFFQTYFELGGSTGPWTYESIDVEAFIEAEPTLNLEFYYEPAEYSTTLVFWAEETV